MKSVDRLFWKITKTYRFYAIFHFRVLTRYHCLWGAKLPDFEKYALVAEVAPLSHRYDRKPRSYNNIGTAPWCALVGWGGGKGKSI